jgi:GTPase SAR1 family protein
MIVFDLTNKKTLENAKTWIDELNENASLDILIALVGNKADMAEERQMTFEVLTLFIFYYLF